MLRNYIEVFLRLFQGREDCFAVQSEDGGYYPKYYPIRDIEIEEHLFRTVSTYGVYLLRSDNTIMFAAIDIDIDPRKLTEVESNEGLAGKQRLFTIAKNEAKKQSDLLTNKFHIPNVVEFSGKKGYHIFFFFKEPIPAYFILKLHDQLVLERNPEITAEWKAGDRYEFFPKQAYASGKGLGNLIKLPLGKHRVSKNYSFLLDSITMERMNNQLDFLVEVDKNYRIKKAYLEELVGEPIQYEITEAPQGKQHRENLHIRFDIDIPSQEIIQPILDEIHALINHNPHGSSDKENKQSIDLCPPCVYNAYIRSKTLKGQFESRAILVRYLANVKRKKGQYGFSPEEIAGFVQYCINDDEDRLHPDRLKYYTAYFYGELGDPSGMDNCENLQKKGFCINFDYKPIEIRILKEIIEFKESIKIINTRQSDIGLFQKDFEQTHDPMYKEAVKDLSEETIQMREKIKKEFEIFKKTYRIRCERIWHPFSHNNAFERMKYDKSLNTEDQMNWNPKEEPNTPKEPNEPNEPNDESSPPESPDTIEEPIFIETKKDPSSELYDSQCSASSDYAIINQKNYQIIDTIKHDPERKIHEIQKSTRVGVTTSLILASKLHNLQVILLEPTNAIGQNTFAQTVKISEDEYHVGKFQNPIYGAVFGSNINMCLKLWKKVDIDLSDKFPNTNLAVYDLPFLFKSTCLKKCKDGTEEVCPFYNCIHVGYPRIEDKITPVIKSYYNKVQTGHFCTRYHHLVQPTDFCHHRTELQFDDVITCKKCPQSYFKANYKYILKNERPICAYATVYRHLMEDQINIRVVRSQYLDNEMFEKNKSQKVTILPESEVIQLIQDGFIPKDMEYSDAQDQHHTGTLLTSEGRLQSDIELIFNIQLKPFDILTLTYTKVLALYQSIENSRKMNKDSTSEGIVDRLKFGFEGIICDEVSHLVAQSPLQFTIYAISRDIDMFGNTILDTKEDDYFQKIGKEIQKINDALPEKLREKEDSPIIYFNALYDYFKHLFEDAKYWIFNPSDLVTESEQEGNLIEFDKLMIQIQNNNIPQFVKDRIRQLQSQNRLKGKINVSDPLTHNQTIDYTKRKVRYINVCGIRNRMKQIVNAIQKYQYDQRGQPEDVTFDWMKEVDKIQTIQSIIEYQQLFVEYQQLMSELKINDDEIAIINEILLDFDDHLVNPTGQSIGKCEKYEIGTFVVIGWSRMNTKLLSDCFNESITRKSTDEIFIQMYSLLTNLAIDKNVNVPNVVNMLMIANVDSFFINSFSTNDYKVKIVFQSMPSFDDIVNLTLGILNSKNKNEHENIHNFAITTDATMPLIDMTSVFGLPTQIWKVGDPKNNCDKQLVIGDCRRISMNDIYGHKLEPTKILDIENIEDYTKKSVYHLFRDMENTIQYVDMSKYLIKFRLFVFINTVLDHYHTNDPSKDKGVFIISPNRSFDLFLGNAMRSGGNGIQLEDFFTDWFQIAYPEEFAEYCHKNWIRIDTLRTTPTKKYYAFHLLPLSKEDEKQYYRGNRTIGTESKCRVMIAITPPSSPINSCEWLSHFYYDKNYVENKLSKIGCISPSDLNKALRRTELQSATFQTFSRVKDPKGKIPSIVFAYGFGSTSYEWGYCEHCERDEQRLYNEKNPTLIDKERNIQTDGIYLTDRLNSNGEPMDLCYDCLTKLGANVIGVSKQEKANLIKPPEGVEDYLAFKIPIPHIYSIDRSRNDCEKEHFFTYEQRMLDIADDFVANQSVDTLIPSEIVRFRNRLVNETIKQCIENNITMLPSDEQIESYLWIPISRLKYSLMNPETGHSKFVNEPQLRQNLSKFGYVNLEKLDIVMAKEGLTRFRLKSFENVIRHIELQKAKGLNKLVEII